MKREREMKENFDFCLQTILKHEGGFVDHPKDPGGATNKGITKKTYENYLRKKVSVDELKEISDDHINGIYSKMYWVPIKGNDLPHGIDLCVFDWAVNSGPRRACKELQSIIGTTADGVIGPITLSLVGNYTPTTLVEELASARETFYRSLSNFDTFGKGWLRRNEETRNLSLGLFNESSE